MEFNKFILSKIKSPDFKTPGFNTLRNNIIHVRDKFVLISPEKRKAPG